VRVGGEQCEVTANNALGMSRVVVERDVGCCEAALHSASRLARSAGRLHSDRHATSISASGAIVGAPTRGIRRHVRDRTTGT
jgi:hypothetical protein